MACGKTSYWVWPCAAKNPGTWCQTALDVLQAPQIVRSPGITGRIGPVSTRDAINCFRAPSLLCRSNVCLVAGFNVPVCTASRASSDEAADRRPLFLFGELRRLKE